MIRFWDYSEILTQEVDRVPVVIYMPGNLCRSQYMQEQEKVAEQLLKTKYT